MEQQTAPLVAANGNTKSSLKVGICADAAVPSTTLQRSASPGGTPQVRFQVTAVRSSRSKQERRRTASSSSHFSDSSSPDDDSVTLERHAPDGGWGWVVVAAAFTVNMIADGICFSFGVFFVEFLRYFGSSKSTTAWLGSIFFALPLLLGPVASLLVDRFGCRKCTIAGSLLSASGFILSYFADSMEILFITFSIMPGIGLSVCCVSAVVIVAYYFERRRSLATGISVCGTGVGTFLFPPLVEHLLQEYGWRGSLLVLSGIFLNMTVCGMLMRDLDWRKHKNRERSSQCTLSADGDSESAPADSDSLPDIERLRNALNSGDVVAMLGRSGGKDQLDRLHSSALQLPTWLAERDVSPEVLKTIETNRRVHELVCRLYPHLLLNGAAAEDSGRSLPAPPPAPPPAPLPTSPPASPVPSTPGSAPVSAQLPALTPKRKEVEGEADAEAEAETKAEAAENGMVKTKHTYNDDVGLAESTGQSADVSDIYNGFHDDASASGGSDGHHSYDVLTSKRDTVVPIAGAQVSRSVPHHHRQHQLHHQRPSHHHLLPLFTSCDPAPSAAYLRNMKLRRQSMTYRGAMLHIQRYRLRASSCPDIYRNSMITITSEEEEEDCCSCFTEILTALRKMFDPAYFRLPGFVLFALSNFVLYMFYDVPYVYLADHAISRGTSDEDASMLISVIGISNVIGVLLVGYLGDRPSVPGTALYVACMVTCGVATLLVPSCDSYSALVAVSSVFGFCISANYTLAPTILVSLISIENFTNAYGLLLLAQGMANLVGPPLCGMLHDLTSTYELTFHASGAAVIVSGLLLCLARLARAARASHRVLKRVTSTETATGGSSEPL